MHPNPTYRRAGEDHALGLVRSRAFGQLTICFEGRALVAHVPFLLRADGDCLDLHLVRSNPIVRACSDSIEALMVVTGPDGYVSPDWYGVDDQVPTWNYTAVHLRGPLMRLDQNQLREVLDRQSAEYEARLPKVPWTTEKMTPTVLDKMMRQIVPFRMQVTQIESTYKLSQNKPDDVRLRAANAIAQSPLGLEREALSRLMESPPEVS